MLDRRGVQDYRGFTDRSIANANQVYDFATWEILNGGGNGNRGVPASGADGVD